MWPYGVTQAKAALPVGAKPLLCHTLQVLHAAGACKKWASCAGTSSTSCGMRQASCGEGPAISWIRQPVPEGTAAPLRHGSASGACTLPLRLRQHEASGLEIAAWLEGHPKVRRVIHPGLKSHPQHELARRQMRGMGGLFSFELDADLDGVRRFVNALSLFRSG